VKEATHLMAGRKQREREKEREREEEGETRPACTP
jgi:hypothetical protein